MCTIQNLMLRLASVLRQAKKLTESFVRLINSWDYLKSYTYLLANSFYLYIYLIFADKAS